MAFIEEAKAEVDRAMGKTGSSDIEMIEKFIADESSDVRKYIEAEERFQREDAKALAKELQLEEAAHEAKWIELKEKIRREKE